MNQKRVRIDWFDLDHLSWMAGFREAENEKGFQRFFQVSKERSVPVEYAVYISLSVVICGLNFK